MDTPFDTTANDTTANDTTTNRTPGPDARPPTDFADHRVVDTRGEQVGTVTDVVYDDRGDRAEFIVVDPGLLRGERVVPVAGCAETPEGDIQVPFTKGQVRKAPKVDGSHVLTEHERREINRHFAPA